MNANSNKQWQVRDQVEVQTLSIIIMTQMCEIAQKNYNRLEILFLP